MKKFLAALALVTSFSAFANDVSPHCDQFMPYGYPSAMGRAHTTQLCRISYYVLHDDMLKTPIYSAELLLPENIGGKNPRINAFKGDPNVQVQSRAMPEDYTGSGLDKGHMAPVEDMRADTAAMMQSFYMSNMVPQNPSLNRGVWRSLESHVRKLAFKNGGVHVITGTIFAARPITTIGNGVGVPTHTYKVVIDKQSGEGIGYIIPNANTKGQTFKQYAVPIIEVERVTGVNFTPSLNSNQDGFKKVIGPGLQ